MGVAVGIASPSVTCNFVRAAVLQTRVERVYRQLQLRARPSEQDSRAKLERSRAEQAVRAQLECYRDNQSRATPPI